jgi:hypothetical protein
MMRMAEEEEEEAEEEEVLVLVLVLVLGEVLHLLDWPENHTMKIC